MADIVPANKPAWRVEFDKQKDKIQLRIDALEKKTQEIAKRLETQAEEKEKGPVPSAKGGLLDTLFGLGEAVFEIGGKLAERNALLIATLNEAAAVSDDMKLLLEKYAIPLWREYPDEFRQWVVEYPELQGKLEEQLMAEAKTRKIAAQLEPHHEEPPKEKPPKRTLSQKVDFFVEESARIRERLKDDPTLADEMIDRLKTELFEGEE